jgi:hypothetical protein
VLFYKIEVLEVNADVMMFSLSQPNIDPSHIRFKYSWVDPLSSWAHNSNTTFPRDNADEVLGRQLEVASKLYLSCLNRFFSA